LRDTNQTPYASAVRINLAKQAEAATSTLPPPIRVTRDWPNTMTTDVDSLVVQLNVRAEIRGVTSRYLPGVAAAARRRVQP
jgi:hypothetical protein